MPKLNIIMGGDYLNGYINLSPVPNEEYPDVINGSINYLDGVIDNGELDELVADKVVEYIPHTQLQSTISNWVSKIRVGGKLVIGLVETLEVCRMMNLGIMNLQQYNNIVHGTQENERLVKFSSVTTQNIIDMVTKPHSYKLISHTLVGVDSTLVFERTA